jgi:hypothetical protein
VISEWKIFGLQKSKVNVILRIKET